jgi:Tol biopolymer transport system component
VYSDISAVDGPGVWLIDVASGEVKYLADGSIPRWLPDGEHIGFHHGTEGLVPNNPAALTEVIYLAHLEGGQIGEITEFARAMDAFWSPDGSRVLLQTDPGSLALANADGSEMEPLLRGFDPAWSSDGERIVFGYDFNADAVPLLAAVDLEGNDLWSGETGSSPVWSPDGTRVAVEVTYPTEMIKVLDTTSGEVLREYAGSLPNWLP